MPGYNETGVAASFDLLQRSQVSQIRLRVLADQSTALSANGARASSAQRAVIMHALSLHRGSRQ
jgi:hypothetical protein